MPTFAMLRDALQVGYKMTTAQRQRRLASMRNVGTMDHPLWYWALSHGMWQAENHRRK